MKTCARCNRKKRLDDFYRSSKAKDGRGSYCKLCSRAAAKQWAAANPDRARQTSQRNQRTFNERHPGYQQRYSLQARCAKYGISVDEYVALTEAQDGKCGICRQPKPLHIDHCHITGAVRGLLCRDCNLGLGRLGDTVEAVKAAATYLGAGTACN